MKIYFLVVLMSWSFGFGRISNQPTYQKVVESPEHAAVVVWDYQQSAGSVEQLNYQGILFEIYIDMTPPDRFRVKETMIKEIEIPLIEFKKKDEVKDLSSLGLSKEDIEVIQKRLKEDKEVKDEIPTIKFRQDKEVKEFDYFKLKDDDGQ